MKGAPGTGDELVGDFRTGYIDFSWDILSGEDQFAERAVTTDMPPRWVSSDLWFTS